ncbi:Polypyrimidine tract-binding 3 [Glycine max]|nr:Polypyrimidine tract-binding 3 [Glycine max]
MLQGKNDLLQLFQPFGVITKLVMLRAKNQALIQMQDVPSAVNALQFYANVQPSIRGRNVYVQFSSHQELTTMDQSQGRGDEPNRILLVTVHHMLYPMTVDVLYQVFSPHGSVEKIVTFQKSAVKVFNVFEEILGEKGIFLAIPAANFSFGWDLLPTIAFLLNFHLSYALIQYQSRQSAVAARSTLQGRNIYDGCCQLDIQFSNLDELQVNYNNDRSRDFTNPNLPTEQKGRPSQPGYGDAGNMYAAQGSGARAVGFPQMANAAAIAAAFGGGLPPGITGTNDRCTVLVSNLNPDRIDEDKLFNLFSIYGNIMRIKLLRNKPDHALIQMGDGFQAKLAVHFLRGAMLFEKRLEVNFSKHPKITPGADTHEYISSNLNRFNRNAAKNYRYCCPPTKMIHLSTLPLDITEEEIVSLVEEHGIIVNSKVFEMNGKKQALVQFENEEQATEALVCKHASTLSGSVIRISFSQLQNI